MQISLFFNLCSCKSAYSSTCPHANQHILQLVLMQISLFFNASSCKIASTASNWSNSVPQEAATTVAFSSVLTLLLFREEKRDIGFSECDGSCIPRTDLCNGKCLVKTTIFTHSLRLGNDKFPFSKYFEKSSRHNFGKWSLYFSFYAPSLTHEISSKFSKKNFFLQFLG